MPLVIPGLRVGRRIHSQVLMQDLACPRDGVMIHYDDSSRDDWSVAWFQDPACKNGYTWLALDDGELVELADPAKRTPHAGASRVKNANSFFYGISAATNGKTPVTTAQLETIIDVTARVFFHHHWKATEVDTRVYGHDQQAVWTADYTKDSSLWGQLGRKVDPTGTRPDHRPIVDVAHIRREVAFRLSGIPR